jgi:hypothetical protein
MFAPDMLTALRMLILFENVPFFMQQVVLAFHWVLSRFLTEWLYLRRICGFKKLSRSFLVSKLVPLNNPDFLLNLLILHLSYILNYFFWKLERKVQPCPFFSILHFNIQLLLPNRLCTFITNLFSFLLIDFKMLLLFIYIHIYLNNYCVK